MSDPTVIVLLAIIAVFATIDAVVTHVRLAASNRLLRDVGDHLENVDTYLRKPSGVVGDAAAYQAFVIDNWQHRRNPAREADPDPLRQLYIMATGLAGENGEVLELLKKHVRDHKPMDVEALRLELGDVIYYACAIAARFGTSLPEILEANRTKLLQRREWGGKAPPAPERGEVA